MKVKKLLKLLDELDQVAVYDSNGCFENFATKHSVYSDYMDMKIKKIEVGVFNNRPKLSIYVDDIRSLFND